MAQPHAAVRETWQAVGWRRRLAALAGVAAALSALVFLPGRFGAVDDQVAGLAQLSPQDRELRAARGTDVDTGIFVLAKRVIPPGATYYVVTGPGVKVSTPVTYAGVSALGRLFMMPRIQVENVKAARYAISYGGDLGALGARATRTWTYQPGMTVAELAP
jgi:hypothetical protein